jgi:WD40 repeat protein
MAPKNHPGLSSGRTVKARALQYIRRQADAELLDHCQNARPAYILNSPHMGKSSLITHTAEQLNASSHHAIIIDLSQFPLPPREQEWFYHIVRILDDNLDLTTDVMSWWEKPSVFALPPHVRLIKLISEVILPEITAPLVLFIDEIERTVSLSFRGHFFEWLASLHESRATNSDLYRYSFVICGVATPSELIPEGGPLIFQWSHRVKLSDFTLNEALHLSEGLSLPTDDANEVVEWVYRWTNGHPYLTQLLCQLLEEQHHKTWIEAEIDECVRHFIVSPQGLREPNFQFIRTALTEPDTQGVSLLKPYLDLLQGNLDSLRNNQPALEQLRLVGVLREDDQEIAIRNPLYEAVFPQEWVKRHLRPSIAIAPTSLPPSVASPFLALKPWFILAASIFLVGIGFLVWSFRGPTSPPLSTTSQEAPAGSSIEAHPTSPTSTEMAGMPQESAALTQAQGKIQTLETTIAEYQRLSNQKLENVHAQRTQLETQLQSQDKTLSGLLDKIETLEAALLDQQQSSQQAHLKFETERAKLAGALAAATSERDAVQQETKSLKTALLKQSSLAPSEIKELLADRNQLENKLTTLGQKLTRVEQKAQELTAALAQEELSAKSEETRFDRDRAKLQTQLNTLHSELRQTKESMKQAEQHSQGQQTLAQQELARLQQARASLQDELNEKKRVLLEQDNRLTSLEAKNGTYRQDLQKALEAKTTLTAQLQDAQQAGIEVQNRVAQLEADLIQHQGTADAKTRTLQQERDQLSQKLAKTLADLETTNNRMTTLTAQLTSTKQELENRHETLRDINTASAEKNRLSDNLLASLAQTRTDLESRLHTKEEALVQAQQRIAELEGNPEKSLKLAQALEASHTENQTLSAKLSSTQSRLESLQATLKRASTVGKKETTSQKGLSRSSEAQIHRILPLITTVITTPSTNALSEKTHLLWARQAYLFTLRHGGQELASIDRSLREGLRTAPIQLKGGSGRIHTLTFNPSGDHVIAGTSGGKILVWSMNKPLNSPQTFSGHTAGILSVTVSPDGTRFVSGSLDSTIRLWDISQPDTPLRILQAHAKGVTSLAFRPDGKQLASGSQDHTIRLWDLTNEQLQPVVLGTHAGRVNAIAYSPDGNSLLSGGDDLALRVWDLQRMDSPPNILRGHQQSISSVAIHSSGWIVATGSRDRQIGLWDLRQSLGSPTFLTGSEGRISQVQFSADGISLASVGSDKTLRIWNWNEPNQPPIQFPEHKGSLETLAISPNGRTIAVAGSSRTVTIWSGTGQLAHAVCDATKENISFGEWKKVVGEEVPYERTCPNLPLHPTFLEEGKRLAQQGAHNQAQAIFERAKLLDPFLDFDPKKEVDKLSAKTS